MTAFPPGAQGPVVLVVEDERKLNALLCDYLRNAGMVPVAVHDGLAVPDAFEAHQPALMLLDLNLPGRDGVAVCKDIRVSSTLPIIMMTARVDEIDKLIGLEAGADDYVCKPYSPREVVARVKAQLRRTRWGSSPQSLSESMPSVASESMDPRLEIDLTRWRVRLNEEQVDLTPAEIRLLHALYTQPGRVLSRQQLLDHLHDDGRAVTDRTVDSHVRNLRRKLANAGDGRDPVRSVYGVGYAFEWPQSA
ncbi:response regulator [Hydrogenophaga sp. 5NK40-0174]|uniref:response regulator n=1 Tax=Hydrogenophaga sp. 5NK40-0174 TaxID=3127649 RepID=UPI00310B9584